MATFVWTGRLGGGDVQTGEIEAASRTVATALLRRQRVAVQTLKPKTKPLNIKIPGLGGDKVTDHDIVILTRQFATMIDAGLPLVTILDILGKQSENKLLAGTILKIKADVEGGASYGDALRKFPQIFDNLYVNMVDAGETGGILDTILFRLSAYLEKNAALKKKIKSALVYPIAIVGVAVLVVVFLLIFVIPTFGKMFSDAGQKLPLPTAIVLGASDITMSYGYLVIPPIVGVVIAFKRYYKTKAGHRKIDGLTLKLPVFGLLLRKVAVSKFTRTLGTLISSGVPIIEALGITARIAGNLVVQEAIETTITSIKQGETISKPLGQTQIFPPMVIQMIQVGETSGALDTMLGKIADFYDEEVDSTVGALTELLEPMLMVFLGTVVGFIVVAMYLPIFNMASTLGS
ncbi:MAG: type II secretion system F family protein [Candidatus Tectomicrobia bacterium]|nr:type II secretion system F family protein [Candidatus Tectomicrobia bacterium]